MKTLRGNVLKDGVHFMVDTNASELLVPRPNVLIT
jgi:hypothetical protein